MTHGDPDPARVRTLRAPLLRWYRRHRRDLPWRRTADPYAIWVSEVMLQQTQVATVVPYYDRFLERFPTIARLAEASEEEVLGAWSGLGYYRRARALHAGVRAVIERHDGALPNDADALRALPGVGRYTAGAIGSIAFGLPLPVLDGNVRRVLSRLFAIRGERHAERDPTLWRIAESLARGDDPGALNQSLMELGALVCTPRSPACAGCPLRRRCAAARCGNVEDYPAPRTKRPLVKVRVAVGCVERGARTLLVRHGGGHPLRGLWDVPAFELGTDADGAAVIRGGLAAYGLDVVACAAATSVSHGILDRRLRLEIHPCRLRRGRVAGRAELRWLDPRALDGVAISGATRKVLRAISDTRGVRV